VDGVAALPILLVVNHQRHRGGGGESGCITGVWEQCLALPKTGITHAKLNGTRCYVIGGQGVFAYPQQEIKGHNNQVSSGTLARGGIGVQTSGGCQLNGMDGESDLGFGDRVTIFEGFKKVGKG